MIFKAYHDGNDAVELSISKLRALRPISKSKTLITYFNGRKNAFAFIDMQMSKMVEDIRKVAGDMKSYGEVSFKDVLKSYDYHHRIRLEREECGTTCQNLCPLCGNITQKYHTNVCSCVIEKPYLGKKLEKKNCLSLTKQAVILTSKSSDQECGIKYDRFGENHSERVVSNITWNEEREQAVGVVKVKGFDMPVYTDQILSSKSLENQRYHWWRI